MYDAWTYADSQSSLRHADGAASKSYYRKYLRLLGWIGLMSMTLQTKIWKEFRQEYIIVLLISLQDLGD